MKTYSLLAALLCLGLPSLPAAEPNFSVSIVGSSQAQEHSFQDPLARKDHGFPVVHLPVRPPPKQDVEPDEASPQGTHFYVVVRNISKLPIRLDLATSAWYDCLYFSITTSDGGTYQVHRPPTAWDANAMEPWIFQPDGMRVFTIDFTTGRWEGLPGNGSVRSRLHFMLDAHFQCLDGDKQKKLDFRSGPMEVQNGW